MFRPDRIKRKLWTSLLGERSWVQHSGGFRLKEKHGLIPRPNYAYGLLRAADVARYFGVNRVTAIEFGVANGDGLQNMTHLADLIYAESGVAFDVVGFDTGEGLPAIRDYRDHPEIWNPGDFTSVDKETLLRDLRGKAEIVWGDINHTLPQFLERISSPIGFISVDVDIYSATKSALSGLSGAVSQYLPAISMYFDDVAFYFANRWCGELLAISEFNDAHTNRKIDVDRSLPGHRPSAAELWYQQMYVCHVLDHPQRQSSQSRGKLSIDAHFDFMQHSSLF